MLRLDDEIASVNVTIFAIFFQYKHPEFFFLHEIYLYDYNSHQCYNKCTTIYNTKGNKKS